MFKYQRKYAGRAIVTDFRRLLETGDVSKLTPRLYHLLVQSGGFIAHYDIDGFRGAFDGRLTRLLHGEMYSLTDPARWERERMQHLEDSGYKDGVSAGDVMRAIVAVGAELAPMVVEREREVARMTEIRYLVNRFGVSEQVATAMMNGEPVEVSA